MSVLALNSHRGSDDWVGGECLVEGVVDVWGLRALQRTALSILAGRIFTTVK